MNAEFLVNVVGRRPAGAVWLVVLSMGAAALAGSGGLHAAPIAPAVQLAQTRQGGTGEEQDTGMSGSQAGPQSGGPAIDQHDEGQSHRPAGTNGSASAGAADEQGKRTGNDTREAPSSGTSASGNSSQGAATNSDRGPGHRGNDTKPGQ
jgi:hypothetical protein